MSVLLGSDALYVPKIGITSMQGVSYGYLLITSRYIFYVPQMSHNVTGYRIMEETSLNVDKYNNLPFWDVVPNVAEEVKDVDQLEKFVQEMAGNIEGGMVFPISEVKNCKISLLAGFTVETAKKKTRFSVGGKRNDIKNFITSKGLLRV